MLECTRACGTASAKTRVASDFWSHPTRTVAPPAPGALDLHALQKAGRTLQRSSRHLSRFRHTLSTGPNTSLLFIRSRSARASYQQFFLGSAHVVQQVQCRVDGPVEGLVQQRGVPVAGGISAHWNVGRARHVSQSRKPSAASKNPTVLAAACSLHARLFQTFALGVSHGWSAPLHSSMPSCPFDIRISSGSSQRAAFDGLHAS